MPLSTQPYKGARDFYPEDKRLQKYMFGVMRRVAESFGYQEYDAPILEPLELYLAKSSEEIVSEQTYSFEDRGGRKMVIRPEMTPTVSRMVAARRQELPYPLRLYSIPNLWRYERPQKGRLREHWQLNVDLFGVAGVAADHEVILVADSVLQAFRAKRSMYEIRINSRQLTNYILHEYLGLEAAQVTGLIRVIDRMDKLPPAEFTAMVEALLSPSQRAARQLERIMAILQAKTLKDLPTEVQAHAAAAEITTLMELLSTNTVTNARFDVSLMRGFDYYTDIVFEVFDTHPDNNRSMFGGGRYDGLVAQFGVEPVPTVGFGMGDVTLALFLQLHELLPELYPETDVVAILVGDVYKDAQKVFEDLRREGVRVAIDSSGRKIDKQFKAADKLGVRYVMVIGEQELQTEQFKLKDLHSGTEESHSLERIIATVAPRHTQAANES